MAHSNNPADHSLHDPSQCDYARIWLTQQWIGGTHEPIVNQLTVDQLLIVGFASFTYSQRLDVESLYAEYGISLQQLFDFSEYIRLHLMKLAGLDNTTLPVHGFDKAHLN